MITHSGARTRALYMWECSDLKRRDGVHQVVEYRLRIVIAVRFYMRFYSQTSNLMFPWLLWRYIPRVEIRQIKGNPYCQGRSLIVLTMEDHLNVTLIHELVHSLGYGSDRNPHNRAFVLKYLEALSWWFGWDIDELKLQAKQWGLI